MDIIGGLTAVKLALDLTKDLRDIDRSIDEAGFKLKLAELTSALADTQVALADAKIKLSDLQEKLAGERKGIVCPICKNGRLQVTDVGHHHARPNLQWHTSTCSSEDCAYQNNRLFDTGANRYRESGEK